jgi:phage/plasmid-associated DNA primase
MDREVRRRLTVLPFNLVISVRERIAHIGQRIGIEEADLLLDWAVDGASRVLTNKRFTEPASSAEALRDWMLSSDQVLSWLESDQVEFTENEWVPQVKAKIAYADFRLWAVEEGYGTACN